MFFNCTTFAICLSAKHKEGNCTVTFSTRASFADSGNATGPLNRPFQLPLLQSSTLYYHRAIAAVKLSNNTLNVSTIGQFTTGDCESEGTELLIGSWATELTIVTDVP